MIGDVLSIKISQGIEIDGDKPIQPQSVKMQLKFDLNTDEDRRRMIEIVPLLSEHILALNTDVWMEVEGKLSVDVHSHRKQPEDIGPDNSPQPKKYHHKRNSKHDRKIEQAVEIIRADPNILTNRKIGETLESVGLEANPYTRELLNTWLCAEGLRP